MPNIPTTPPTRPTLRRDGADPDQLVDVPAGELFDWAWLTAELADWLHHAGQATRRDFHRHFDGLRDPDKAALFLTMISQRITALLAGDRGQP